MLNLGHVKCELLQKGNRGEAMGTMHVKPIGTPAPHQLSAADAARRIAQGQLTSEQLVRSCLEEISRRDAQLHAWAALNGTATLAAAREMDRSRPRSALHGVPVGVKDVIDTSDFPTRFNSPIHAERRPARDAAVVARAREAGLVVLGKTATQEFASRGDAGPTRHPFSPAHSPGGSSNGSCVAVASSMVPLAISTQTAGSIVRPASYCGVVGFKPGFSVVDTSGTRLIVPSFDTLGFHARCVEDIALALEVFGSKLAEPRQGPEQALRISICRSPVWHKASVVVRDALAGAGTRLQQAGMLIDEIELPVDFDEIEAAHDTISDFEARDSLAYEWTHHRGRLSPGIQAKLLKGEATGEGNYNRAKAVIEACRASLSDLFARRDALLAPSAPDVAPPYSRTETGDSAFSKGWTALGLPCISLPLSTGPSLPIGVQFVGAPGRDWHLLDVAKQAEGAFTLAHHFSRRHA